MKAIRMRAFGGPDALALDELPMPQPRDDEVVLKIHAASPSNLRPPPWWTQGDVWCEAVADLRQAWAESAPIKS